MYCIEYKHKKSVSEESWKSMKIAAIQALDASTCMANLTKLYGEDFVFRMQVMQVVANVKSIT